MTEHIPEDQPEDMDELYRSVSPSLFRRALVLTQGDQHAAEDLVHETFTAAMERWRVVGPRNDEDRRRWLFKVLEHKAIDRWRRDHRMVLVDRFVDDELSAQTTDPDPTAHEVMTNDEIDRFWEKMKVMPRARYRVAYLAWQLQWSNREISDHLGISESTVRVHLRNARQQLRSWLEGGDDEGRDDEGRG